MDSRDRTSLLSMVAGTAFLAVGCAALLAVLLTENPEVDPSTRVYFSGGYMTRIYTSFGIALIALATLAMPLSVMYRTRMIVWSPWYRERLGRRHWTAQIAAWSLHGWLWIPGWYVLSASAFSDWYSSRLGRVPVPLQIVAWCAYGVMWIPLWYALSAPAFREWYRKKLGVRPLAIQCLAWLFGGYFWIPLWHFASSAKEREQGRLQALPVEAAEQRDARNDGRANGSIAPRR